MLARFADSSSLWWTTIRFHATKCSKSLWIYIDSLLLLPILHFGQSFMTKVCNNSPWGSVEVENVFRSKTRYSSKVFANFRYSTLFFFSEFSVASWLFLERIWFDQKILSSILFRVNVDFIRISQTILNQTNFFLTSTDVRLKSTGGDGSIFRSERSKHGFDEIVQIFFTFSPWPNRLTWFNSIKTCSKSSPLMFFTITLWKVGGKLRLFEKWVGFAMKVLDILEVKQVRNQKINKMFNLKFEISHDLEWIRLKYLKKSCILIP